MTKAKTYRKHNWRTIRDTYVMRGDMPSLRKVAKEYDADQSQISKRSRREGWEKRRKDYWDKVSQKDYKQKMEQQVNLILKEWRKHSPPPPTDNIDALYEYYRPGMIRKGLMPLNEEIRSSIKYGIWREQVFIRDDFTCQKCGMKGGDIEAHHIKSLSKFPELGLVISNGLTLCKKCHIQTENYGGKGN